MPTPSFTCHDCKEFGWSAILKDSLWKEITNNNTKILLCLSCIETRLGRQIRLNDLQDVEINKPIKYLLQRIENI